jgi:cytochrome c553
MCANGGGMRALKGQLSNQQINDVAAFVTKKITGS